MRWCLLLFALLSAAPLSAAPPNVLLIQTDDQGWGDLRCHGNDQIDTPILDRLSKEGVRFTNFHVSPLCAPTRASLLTGRYHLRTGVQWVTSGLETLRLGEWTLAEALKGAGYSTGCFGKWHLGAYYPYHPTGRGFDTFVGFCGGHLTNYFDPTLQRGRQTFRGKGFITDVLTDEAVAFLKRSHKAPFFCYVAYNAPHAPFQLADALFDKYRKRGLSVRTSSIYGLVENVDTNIGRLLKALQEGKLDRDTIVVFLSDNGPNGPRFNGDLRGTKGTVHEGGTRSPLIVRWPAGFKGGRSVDRLAAHIDLMPTLLDLCGVKRKPPAPFDGVSLRPLLEGKEKGWPDRMVFVHSSGRELGPAPGGVRTQRHRLVLTRGGDVELYDMQADPQQKKDVSDDQLETTTKLKRAYDAWYRDVTRAKIAAPPIPIGHPEAGTVDLDAVDAFTEGRVEFKGSNGWAHDWLTRWSRTTDTIAWELDVVRGGRYEVALLYTSPKADVGARVCVEVGGKRLEATIREAHDPPARVGPDRVPRGEVAEKEWKELPCGAVDLEKGSALLQVRALKIPGRAVADLKGVRLRRVEAKTTPKRAD